MASSLLRGLLPYPDLFRRRRVRSDARELVSCSPWPGNGATPLQLAELSLLRALWLQRETHHALLWRQEESASLLARTAVENCITGLYFLYSESPMEELRGGNSLALEHLCRYLIEAGVVTQNLIDIVRDAIGGSGKLPSVADMADVVAKGTSDELSRNLYRRLYVPLSAFFAHANGLVLLRHVRSNGSLRERPAYPWVRRSAARTADGCVGILALAVASRADRPVTEFAEYADAHLKRSLAPLVIMAGRGFGTSTQWRRFPKAVRDVRAAIKYHRSEEFEADAWEIRELRTRESTSGILRILDPQSVDEHTVERMIDELVAMILGPRPEESGNTGDS